MATTVRTAGQRRIEESAEPLIASRSRIRDLILASLVAITTWPDVNRLPVVGVDDAWNYSLTEASRRGVDWGTEVAFTYGPLVYLDGGPIYGVGSGAAALVIRFLLASLTALLVLRVAEDLGWRLWLRLGAAWLFVTVAIPSELFSEAVVTVTAAWLLYFLSRRGHVPPGPLLASALVAGLWLNVKPSAAVVLLGVVCLAPLPTSGVERARATFPSGPVARLASVVVAAAGAAIIGWTVSGQAVTSIPGFVRSWREQASGFAEGMGNQSNQLLWVELALIGLLFLLFFIQLRMARVKGSSWGWVQVVIVGGLLVWGRQIGLTRPDEGHMIDLAVLVAMLGLVLLTPALWRLAAVAVAVSLVLVAGLSPYGVPALTNGVPVAGGVGELAAEIEDLRSGDVIEEARSGLASQMDIPAEALLTVAGAPVHISSEFTNLAFAHPELGFWMLPTVQHYASYTNTLEERNAEALGGPDGPAYVLHLPEYNMDRHHPAWESPRVVHTIWCDFTPTHTDGTWHLLAATERTCSPPTQLGAPVPATGSVPIPAAARSCPGIVTFSISGGERGPVDALVGHLTRQGRPFAVIDGEAWPLISTTSRQPHIIAAPRDDAAWLGGHTPAPDKLPSEISFGRLGPRLFGAGAPTVEFECWTRGQA